MRLSVVSTLYQSSSHVRDFCSRMVRSAERIGPDFELILVDDGSPDDSLAIALELRRADPRIKVIELSRNFGHHKAAMTGLMHARGELVFLVDADLEEEPELLELFHARLLESGADVTFGVQTRRKGGLFERVGGSLFYRLFNALSTHPVPPNLLMARLMRRRFVRALVAHRESELDISGLWSITGFRQLPVPVEKRGRGRTTYSPAKRIALAVRSITAFSNRPLVWIAVLGAGILALSLAYFLYLTWVRLFLGEPPSGFTTLILSIWFLGGLTIFSLGVIAIYLSVIFVETKRRPYTIVREAHGIDPEEEGPE